MGQLGEWGSLIEKTEQNKGARMDEKEYNLAYELGRMMAIDEYIAYKCGSDTRICYQKLRELLLTNPRAGFVQLAKHRVKNEAIARRGKLKIIWQFIKLSKIICSLPSTGIPQRFTNEEGARFMLGYYHTKAAGFKIAEKKQKETTKE